MSAISAEKHPRSILAHLVVCRARRENRNLTDSEQERVKGFEAVASETERDEQPGESILAFIRRGAR